MKTEAACVCMLTSVWALNSSPWLQAAVMQAGCFLTIVWVCSCSAEKQCCRERESYDEHSMPERAVTKTTLPSSHLCKGGCIYLDICRCFRSAHLQYMVTVQHECTVKYSQAMQATLLRRSIQTCRDPATQASHSKAAAKPFQLEAQW